MDNLVIYILDCLLRLLCRSIQTMNPRATLVRTSDDVSEAAEGQRGTAIRMPSSDSHSCRYIIMSFAGESSIKSAGLSIDIHYEVSILSRGRRHRHRAVDTCRLTLEV